MNKFMDAVADVLPLFILPVFMFAAGAAALSKVPEQFRLIAVLAAVAGMFFAFGINGLFSVAQKIFGLDDE